MELREMVERKVISSVNQGIRYAVADFIKTHKLNEYHQKILEASNDNAYIKRTMDTQKTYQFLDAEMEDSW